MQNELSFQKQTIDKKMDDRLAKTEMNAERSLDEIFYLRD